MQLKQRILFPRGWHVVWNGKTLAQADEVYYINDDLRCKLAHLWACIFVKYEIQELENHLPSSLVRFLNVLLVGLLATVNACKENVYHVYLSSPVKL